jgi:hypothetical protein
MPSSNLKTSLADNFEEIAANTLGALNSLHTQVVHDTDTIRAFKSQSQMLCDSKIADAIDTALQNSNKKALRQFSETPTEIAISTAMSGLANGEPTLSLTDCFIDGATESPEKFDTTEYNLVFTSAKSQDTVKALIIVCETYESGFGWTHSKSDLFKDECKISHNGIDVTDQHPELISSLQQLCIEISAERIDIPRIVPYEEFQAAIKRTTEIAEKLR